jgi:hypothetical protein
LSSGCDCATPPEAFSMFWFNPASPCRFELLTI